MTELESYTLTESSVVRGSDGASIPADDSNRDWRAYQEWVDAGNTATPYTPEPVTVEQVEAQRRQAFVTESDPLFFRWQAGSGVEQAWLDARVAVQARLPYPTA